MKTISSNKFKVLPIIPLVCLAKANRDENVSASQESTIIKALVDFCGSSKIECMVEEDKIDKLTTETHNLLLASLHQNIENLYLLKDRLSRIGAKEKQGYLEIMLSHANVICSEVESSNASYVGLMIKQICRALSISEADLSEYHSVLKFFLAINNDSQVEQQLGSEVDKNKFTEQILDNRFNNTQPASVKEIQENLQDGNMTIEFSSEVYVTTPEVLINAVAKSLSLDLHEKRRVLFEAPQLSNFQIEQLLITFEDEIESFKSLEEEHPADIHWLTVKRRIEWLHLKETHSSGQIFV